jgi:hypothetical protein
MRPNPRLGARVLASTAVTAIAQASPGGAWRLRCAAAGGGVAVDVVAPELLLAATQVGLGRIVALCHRPSTLYQN